MYQDIKEFHEEFGLRYDGVPKQLDEETAKFRIKFMHEELNEYCKACEEGDLEGQFDALIDLAYVALGTAYMQGLPFDKGWDEVHSCNMLKARAGPNGEGSKRGSPLDVIKPMDWQGPRLGPLLIWAVCLVEARKQNDMFASEGA